MKRGGGWSEDRANMKEGASGEPGSTSVRLQYSEDGDADG